MKRLAAIPARWRGAAFLPAAVMAVHQLRYLLAYGSHYRQVLVSHGDGYVDWLTPVCVALLALLIGGALGRAAEAWRSGVSRTSRRLSWPALWCAIAVALVVCFCAQEWLELLLEPGRGGGLLTIFGSGGWWALPVAVAVAALLALLLRGTDAALAVIARWGGSRRRIARLTPGGLADRFGAPRRVVSTPALASCCAGRAPPRGAMTA